MTVNFQKRLIAYIEINFNYNIKIENIDLPLQGMSSSVFFIKLANDIEFAVKYGVNAANDLPVIDLIKSKQIHIPIPVPLTSFIFENVPVIIIEKITSPLLESASVEEMSKYIPSIVRNLNALHTIKSKEPGRLHSSKMGETWKSILLSIFDGTELNWIEIAERESLDRNLILNSVGNVKNKIKNSLFDTEEYSLLHTDFNQRNLFIDSSKYEISGIIDWEDGLFGDPLYDFARVRMMMWHFNFTEESISNYYNLVNFTTHQMYLEDLYWLSRVIQYLAWYSEDLTKFNLSRIKFHQDYLRKYIW